MSDADLLALAGLPLRKDGTLARWSDAQDAWEIIDVRWITAEPRGFRDIYWCPFLNEPVILKYDGHKPKCDGCGNVYDSVEQMADDTHTFICHVLKPRE